MEKSWKTRANSGFLFLEQSGHLLFVDEFQKPVAAVAPEIDIRRRFEIRDAC
jgi:hypothetical protein